jgi:hypothetical protein
MFNPATTRPRVSPSSCSNPGLQLSAAQSINTGARLIITQVFLSPFSAMGLFLSVTGSHVQRPTPFFPSLRDYEQVHFPPTVYLTLPGCN